MPLCTLMLKLVTSAARLLVGDHRLVRERAAAAAVGLGNAGAQQAHLAGLAPDRAVGEMLLAPARLERRALALEHLAHAVAELRDVVGHPGRQWRHRICSTALDATRDA